MGRVLLGRVELGEVDNILVRYLYKTNPKSESEVKVANWTNRAQFERHYSPHSQDLPRLTNPQASTIQTINKASPQSHSTFNFPGKPPTNYLPPSPDLKHSKSTPSAFLLPDSFTARSPQPAEPHLPPRSYSAPARRPHNHSWACLLLRQH